MLIPPNEIGGMYSDHDETLEHAKKSVSWKKTWVNRGKTKTRITVDHKLLIETGVIRLNDEEEEEYEEEIEDDLIVEENLSYSETPLSE